VEAKLNKLHDCYSGPNGRNLYHQTPAMPKSKVRGEASEEGEDKAEDDEGVEDI
jgi:hypothetical protein